MGYGGFKKVIFEVPHWECPCGQPNSMDREMCLACEKVPKEKKSMSRGGRPRETECGIIERRYFES